MNAVSPDLKAHLETGATTLCRAWALTRKDGVVMGFTDHDGSLSFDGITFQPQTGMSAKALVQTTGLSVDNTEAVGALTDSAISEADIIAGRYDGAKVTAWLVNWADPEQRLAQFSGEIGELVRTGGAFRAELRGLTELLNLPQGRVYQHACSAVLGGAGCMFDVNNPGYSTEETVEISSENRVISLPLLPGFDQRWFEAGRLEVLDGDAAGLVGIVKNDRLDDTHRRIELWESLRADVQPGDRVRLIAGCDKRAETCRVKFNNYINFQGFPHIPGDDWLVSYPVKGSGNNGGSLNS